MIAVIDMGLGNLDSVRQAFDRIGTKVRVTDDPECVAQATAVVLPGVGAFGDGMAGLRASKLIEPLRRHALEKRGPLLGICLGMQLLAEGSDEFGWHHGLGLMAGKVRQLRPRSSAYRVPNVGWCDVTFRSRSAPFASFAEPESFYFAHSYYLECDDRADVAGTIEYDGERIAVAIQRGNLIGVQFHPEKSQDAGLALVESFVRHVARQPQPAAA